MLYLHTFCVYLGWRWFGWIGSERAKRHAKTAREKEVKWPSHGQLMVATVWPRPWPWPWWRALRAKVGRDGPRPCKPPWPTYLPFPQWRQASFWWTTWTQFEAKLDTSSLGFGHMLEGINIPSYHLIWIIPSSPFTHTSIRYFRLEFLYIFLGRKNTKLPSIFGFKNVGAWVWGKKESASRLEDPSLELHREAFSTHYSLSFLFASIV